MLFGLVSISKPKPATHTYMMVHMIFSAVEEMYMYVAMEPVLSISHRLGSNVSQLPMNWTNAITTVELGH